MDVLKLTFRREQLDALSVIDRTLLLCLAHLANEVNYSTKLFTWCVESASSEAEELETLGRVAQGMMIGRMLTGKLWEGWRLFKKVYFDSKLSKIYEPKFDKEASEALKNLKRYFGRRENLIRKVRNDFSFHYSPEDVEGAYSRGEFDDEMSMYLEHANANSHYAFAEAVVFNAMLNAIDESDPQRAIDRLMDETARVTGWFNSIIAACVFLALESVGELHQETISVKSSQRFSDVRIPFLTDTKAR